LRVFAAGSLTNEMRIEVSWRSGRRSVINGVTANWIYETDEAQATSNLEPRTLNLEQRPANLAPQPLFEDVSGLIAHKHDEPDYDDFSRQPLLPKKLSQLGPGVAWCDLDGDGHDDLIIGSGRGGKLAVYRNGGDGRFAPWPDAAWDQAASDDQTAVVGIRLREGATLLLVGSATYETSESRQGAANQFVVQGRQVLAGGGVPANGSSAGPIAIADLDGDGALEVFVGGRVIPGRFPEAASSRIFRLKDGR